MTPMILALSFMLCPFLIRPTDATLTFDLKNVGPSTFNPKLVSFLMTMWIGSATARPVPEKYVLPTIKPGPYVGTGVYDESLRQIWCSCRVDMKENMRNETDKEQYIRCETRFAIYGILMVRKMGMTNPEENVPEVLDWVYNKVMHANCTDFYLKIGAGTNSFWTIVSDEFVNPELKPKTEDLTKKTQDSRRRLAVDIAVITFLTFIGVLVLIGFFYVIYRAIRVQRKIQLF